MTSVMFLYINSPILKCKYNNYVCYNTIIVGLAVDWVTLKIYWSAYNEHVIKVHDLVTLHYKDLINLESGANPYGIVIDPTARYSYSILC